MGWVDKGVVAAHASASSMILCNAEANKDEMIADLHMLPATHITMLTGLFSTPTSTLRCKYHHSKWVGPTRPYYILSY
ncbi:hypothetical protein Hanom_Chr11g01025761 [Helianthus anomalus]